MKSFHFLVCVILTLPASAQKVALLHRSFRQPIVYTDSITVEQVSTGYFPLQVDNVDTFYANLKYLHDMLSTRQRAKMESFELHAGNSIIITDRVPMAYGDRYNILAKTKVAEVEAQMRLSNQEEPNKKSAKRIKRLMDYISKNKSLFRAPTEIHPRIYYMQVISDH